MSNVRNNIKNHLKLLISMEDNAFQEICSLCRHYLINGPNNDEMSSIAKTLSYSHEEMRALVESLIYILIDVSQIEGSEEKLREFLKSKEFNGQQADNILKLISQQKLDYDYDLLNRNNANCVKYRDLEWRVETTIASRMNLLHQSYQPSIAVKLHVDSEKINENKDKINVVESATNREVFFTTDLNNLSYIIKVLEQALQESKTHRVRNFSKAFQ